MALISRANAMKRKSGEKKWKKWKTRREIWP